MVVGRVHLEDRPPDHRPQRRADVRRREAGAVLQHGVRASRSRAPSRASRRRCRGTCRRPAARTCRRSRPGGRGTARPAPPGGGWGRAPDPPRRSGSSRRTRRRRCHRPRRPSRRPRPAGRPQIPRSSCRERYLSGACACVGTRRRSGSATSCGHGSTSTPPPRRSARPSPRCRPRTTPRGPARGRTQLFDAGLLVPGLGPEFGGRNLRPRRAADLLRGVHEPADPALDELDGRQHHRPVDHRLRHAGADRALRPAGAARRDVVVPGHERARTPGPTSPAWRPRPSPHGDTSS